MICAAWKFLGEKHVHSVSVLSRKRNKLLDDRHICEKLKSVLDSADAVVTQNGDQFDLPWIRTRLAFHKLKPFKPLIQIDTKKIAKGHFRFNSNSLDYMSKFLTGDSKIKTDFDLWIKCMAGDRNAICEMVRYNKHDVEVLEKVYRRLQPFVPAKLNMQHFGGSEKICPTCGSEDLQSWGRRYTVSRVHVRYRCMACGAWSYRPYVSQVVR